MTEDLLELPPFAPGTVWLTGAGPGDPGLLTLLALHALKSADVIVYDALVDPRILELANPKARRIHAGKRGGRPSPSQADISRTLVEEARKNLRVLRLKGGDPFVFGRGGEEALALAAAGIPFRLVPGITAGIGGLAYAGIPATHRDVNSAVAFVTGHAAGGDLPGDVEWEALGRGAPVLVIYMAVRHLGRIAKRLMESGRAPDEPVAVVSRATTPAQEVLETTLARAAADAEKSGIKPPAIVVVGRSVALRAGLDWLGALEGRALDPDPLKSALKSPLKSKT
ncbi:MAG TPA: uroporphyrinogen-III C-methyltransferase [Alphaproteobacteria bacterium]|nr:uroporphyrinogen-III C-methyltransferase [Alphaproteobacteria bacterium]